MAPGEVQRRERALLHHDRKVAGHGPLLAKGRHRGRRITPTGATAQVTAAASDKASKQSAEHIPAATNTHWDPNPEDQGTLFEWQAWFFGITFTAFLMTSVVTWAGGHDPRKDDEFEAAANAQAADVAAAGETQEAPPGAGQGRVSKKEEAVDDPQTMDIANAAETSKPPLNACQAPSGPRKDEAEFKAAAPVADAHQGVTNANRGKKAPAGATITGGSEKSSADKSSTDKSSTDKSSTALGHRITAPMGGGLSSGRGHPLYMSAKKNEQEFCAGAYSCENAAASY